MNGSQTPVAGLCHHAGNAASQGPTTMGRLQTLPELVPPAPPGPVPPVAAPPVPLVAAPPCPLVAAPPAPVDEVALVMMPVTVDAPPAPVPLVPETPVVPVVLVVPVSPVEVALEELVVEPLVEEDDPVDPVDPVELALDPPSASSKRNTEPPQ
jgi:hypothetical protein